MLLRISFLLLIFTLLAGCDSQSQSASADQDYMTTVESAETLENSAETEEQTDEQVEEQTDEQVEEQTDEQVEEQTTFGGNDCTQDCSGHRAGYNWAENHGINDPADCGGNSQSFIEGCESYADGQ